VVHAHFENGDFVIVDFFFIFFLFKRNKIRPTDVFLLLYLNRYSSDMLGFFKH